MSTTLAAVTEALIEFILSLLRDPEAAAEFNADPEGALDARGLSGVSHMEACAVAPVVLDRPNVVPTGPEADPAVMNVVRTTSNSAISEIQNIVNNFSWLNNTSTIVDQSTNQSIWAEGDVTQIFDQEAIVASGEDSIAAGDDVSVEQTQDNSTNITAGDDVNVGNDTDISVIEDSYNETTDSSQTTDGSQTTTVTDSANTTAVTEATEPEPEAAAPEPVPAYTEAPVDSAPQEAPADDLAMTDDLPLDDDI